MEGENVTYISLVPLVEILFLARIITYILTALFAMETAAGLGISVYITIMLNHRSSFSLK